MIIVIRALHDHFMQSDEELKSLGNFVLMKKLLSRGYLVIIASFGLVILFRASNCDPLVNYKMIKLCMELMS